uniref:Uncharacterized protein n=1 Tax=viral metagenome TaxID=1070528 RepID=A0A6M3JXR0_9ZZZZ
MTYTKTFNPEKFAPIASVLEQLQALVPGEKLTISLKTKAEQTNLRWLVYDWLHHMGLKEVFRLRVEDLGLEIKRRIEPEFEINISSPIGKAHLDKLLKETITSSEPIEFLRSKKEAGKINAEEFGWLLGKYDKIVS